MKCIVVTATICACVLSIAIAAGNDAPDRFLPPESLNVRLAAPIGTWDEGVALGNGLMGGLLWGKDNMLRLSMDRGDLWDLRVPNEFQKAGWNWKTIQKLVAGRNQDELVRRFTTPQNVNPFPTKLPGGRVELTLDPSQRATSFTLDLAHARGQVELTGGGRIEAFFSAAAPVCLLRIPGPAPKQWRIIAPTAVKALGYPPAKKSVEGNAQWYLQETTSGTSYALLGAVQRVGDATLLAVTIASTTDGPDPVAIGRKRLADALQTGYQNMLTPHEAWWRAFWQKSRVELPEVDHLRQYYLAQYFYGSASRRGAPPIPLAGVWTEDSGGLPPWKGDYHNDFNTEAVYSAYQTTGRWDEGLCFLDFLWKLLPAFRAHARNFYDAPGAAVPGAMALDGKPIGGYPMASFHPTYGAWLGDLFYEHWRYTLDEAFLRDRAYPWCAEIGRCLLHVLKSDAHGVLKLPLSSSPEIHEMSLAAWLTPNSNFDHDCMAALFGGLAEMADVLNKKDEAATWRHALAGLGARAVDPQTHCLMLAPDESLHESHRHLSHMMSIHPLGLLTMDGSDRDRAVIAATCQRIDALGTGMWLGFSFAWMSCVRARQGDAEAAIKQLDIFDKAFILRNGFCANGDQTKGVYSMITYRPVTLDGNFLACQAVHEMLLQSWGGAIRLFPATPARWRQAAFEDLRAEGGYRISARRDGGATRWLKIAAGRDDTVKIRDNFAGHTPMWSRPDVKKVGNDWQCRLQAGEMLEARLP